MKIEMRTFDIRAADTGESEKRIEGYAAVFDSWSGNLGGFKEIIRKGAFKDAVKNCDVRCLFNHNTDFVLGRTKAGTLQLREEDKGLWFSCLLPETKQAEDVYTMLRRGDIDQCSFGFTVKEKGERWTPAHARGELDERELLDLNLFDVSVVTYPAYEATSAHARSGETDTEAHERFVRDRIARNKNKMKMMEVENHV